MGNVLGDDKRHQIVALGRLGWSLRRIEQATGVRRETISGYLKAAAITVRGPGRRSESKAKPAISPPPVSTDPDLANPAIVGEVSTDPARPKPAISHAVSTDLGAVRPGRAPSASACEPYRELITEALARGRNAMAIWQDLVDGHGFRARYASVRRFVAAARGHTAREAHVVITTAPGDEGQVDYGDGPMIRHPKTGKYRRVRLFVLTLGYSRKSIRLLAWQ
jgi:transposase